MLFSPSAFFGGTAAPIAWHLAVTQDGPLSLRLAEAQEPALAAYPSEGQRQGERVAAERVATERMALAATGEFLGWAKGVAADRDCGPAPAVMEQSGADLRPPLTGPLLPRAGTAGPGLAWPCGTCGPATPMYPAATP
jgi:hypothetical protein